MQEGETKLFAMKLPVPDFRKQSAQWFCDNTCIEYMFENDVLKQYNVEFETERGTTYEKIRDLNSAKQIIQENVKDFESRFFEPFRPIFDAINEYVKII